MGYDNVIYHKKPDMRHVNDHCLKNGFFYLYGRPCLMLRNALGNENVARFC
jgi:hypothetical protein